MEAVVKTESLTKEEEEKITEAISFGNVFLEELRKIDGAKTSIEILLYNHQSTCYRGLFTPRERPKRGEPYFGTKCFATHIDAEDCYKIQHGFNALMNFTNKLLGDQEYVKQINDMLATFKKYPQIGEVNNLYNEITKIMPGLKNLLRIIK